MISAKITHEYMVVGYRKRNREEEVILKKKFFTIYAAVLIMAVILFHYVFMLAVVPTESMAGTSEPGSSVPDMG